MRNVWRSGSAGITLYLCVAPALLFSQVESILADWQNDKTLAGASIGVCVLDAKSAKPVFQYQQQIQLVPASTLKIVSTTSALKVLGPDFKFETKICYTGKFDKSTGILDGDLIIVGSGDPTLQSEYFNKTAVTDGWANILKNKGIREITGKIIGDASCFERNIPGSWVWEDISNYYGALPCGLSFKDNKFKITLNSTEAGHGTTAVFEQPYFSKKINISNEVTAGGTSDQAFVFSDPLGYDKRMSGTIPPNKKNFDIEAALPDPALLCAEALYRSCQKAGIKCDQKKIFSNYNKRTRLYDPANVLFSHFSPTLDKIIFFTNQNSNNMYCESLVLCLGEGERAQGIQSIKKNLVALQLDTTSLFMEDGCGLSRVNTSSTLFQANLLQKIYNDSILNRVINASLPLAGKNGSMSNIGKGSFIENNLRAKTGYMKRARAYCGYVRTRSGRDLAFSVILNNYACTAKEARLKIEKLLIALADL